MSLKTRLTDDMKAAMKAGEKSRLALAMIGTGAAGLLGKKFEGLPLFNKVPDWNLGGFTLSPFTLAALVLAFLFVNALLLGRDLEDMLIARHGKAYGTLGKVPRFLLGLAGTAAMLIPFVNLVVPVIATAGAVHMAHGVADRRSAPVA